MAGGGVMSDHFESLLWNWKLGFGCEPHDRYGRKVSLSISPSAMKHGLVEQLSKSKYVLVAMITIDSCAAVAHWTSPARAWEVFVERCLLGTNPSIKLSDRPQIWKLEG